MLAQTAIQLNSGDTFTSNDGVDWYTVHTRLIVPTNSGKEAVLIMTEDYEKVWLWCDEDVVVRV
jgi:hypothetical protein